MTWYCVDLSACVRCGLSFGGRGGTAIIRNTIATNDDDCDWWWSFIGNFLLYFFYTRSLAPPILVTCIPRSTAPTRFTSSYHLISSASVYSGWKWAKSGRFWFRCHAAAEKSSLFFPLCFYSHFAPENIYVYIFNLNNKPFDRVSLIHEIHFSCFLFFMKWKWASNRERGKPTQNRIRSRIWIRYLHLWLWFEFHHEIYVSMARITFFLWFTQGCARQRVEWFVEWWIIWSFPGRQFAVAFDDPEIPIMSCAITKTTRIHDAREFHVFTKTLIHLTVRHRMNNSQNISF